MTTDNPLLSVHSTPTEDDHPPTSTSSTHTPASQSPAPDQTLVSSTHSNQRYISVPSNPSTPSPTPAQPSETSEHASWARIYSLCIANFGINCAWALEFAITTPYFEKSLNSGKVISHAVWIVGPLSGLIVAPIVGSLSDRCKSPFGRRRPFILAGLFATVIGMLLFSNAASIANILTTPKTTANHVTALVVAILSFCLLDLAINTTMWPVRALQGDLIPNAQQHSIQSASIVMFSLGDMAASALINAFREPVAHIRLCFLVAALIYASTVFSLLVFGREVPLQEEEEHEGDPLHGNGSVSDDGHSFNIFTYLKSLPRWMWRVGTTHALGFFALFCFLPNTSSWLGSTVLGGDPNADPGSKKAKLYESGVSMYGRASLTRSVIQIVYSAIYPWLLNFVTPAQLMSLSFGVFGALLMIFSGTHRAFLGQLVVMSMALPIGAHFTLPVGLTVENSDSSNRGKYLGALNCFAVIPQFIDTAYTGFVSRAFGEVAVMRIGAGWALLTSVFALLYMRIRV